MSRYNGQAVGLAPHSFGQNSVATPSKKAKPKAKSKVKPRTGGVEMHHIHQHAPSSPSVPHWVWALAVNLGVMILSCGISYGLLQGDISYAKQDVVSLRLLISQQSTRLDKMNEEQTRVTRLEENIKSIASLLSEIKDDLRSGRYTFPNPRGGGK